MEFLISFLNRDSSNAMLVSFLNSFEANWNFRPTESTGKIHGPRVYNAHLLWRDGKDPGIEYDMHYVKVSIKILRYFSLLCAKTSYVQVSFIHKFPNWLAPAEVISTYFSISLLLLQCTNFYSFIKISYQNFPILFICSVKLSGK